MSDFHLVKNVKKTLVQAPLAVAASTSRASAHVDMANFDGVEFTGTLGTYASTANAALKVQVSTSTTSWADLSGATASSTASKADGLLIIDVPRPRQRYVRTFLTHTTTGGEYGGTVASQYGARKLPVSHASTTLAAAAVLTVPQTT